MYRFAIVSAALASLTGCGTYSAVNVGSFVATGKGLTDHGASFATGADCNLLKHIWTGKYVCEKPTVYNQHPL